MTTDKFLSLSLKELPQEASPIKGRISTHAHKRKVLEIPTIKQENLGFYMIMWLTVMAYIARLAQQSIINLKYTISTTTHWFLSSGNICLPHPCQRQLPPGNTSFLTSSHCPILRCFSQADISILQHQKQHGHHPSITGDFCKQGEVQAVSPPLKQKEHPVMVTNFQF